MAISCYIKIIGDNLRVGAGVLPVFTFGEVPREGEFVGFSRDGKRDDRGVLSQDLYRVKRVIHTAATELNPAMIILDVVLEQPVD